MKVNKIFIFSLIGMAFIILLFTIGLKMSIFKSKNMIAKPSKKESDIIIANPTMTPNVIENEELDVIGG